ncbi:DUF47 domain-containing protein [Coxiella endosymbiont of Ornithodoros amblus]|uniref:DUF47 domain-containing protein n=1 Tax=Coxiella endosymbiont of Ornithodoros amblus TaxID=1656166 RepID=UPI00244DDB12|nr:DUF47 family protein [Coxiella endosymbiont of Ornithodoros amblus]
MTELENEADELKRNFQRHLPKSLFLPVPRSDLLTLSARQDKIVNTPKDIAGIILGRKIEIPVEKTLLTVNVIFLYKIIEQIGYLANHAKQTGNHLKLLMAH